MKIHAVTPSFSVTSQISIEDVERAKQAGFNSIICNRPDAEEANQPEHKRIKAQVEKKGMHFCYAPTSNLDITEQDIKTMQSCLSNLPQPILGYCRTGKRAIVMWANAVKSNYTYSELVTLSNAAGYDISKVLKH